MTCEQPAGNDVAALTSAAPGAAQLDFVLDGQTLGAPCTSYNSWSLIISSLPVSSAPLKLLLAVPSAIRRARLYSTTANTADTKRERQNLMAQMAFTAAMVMLLSAGLTAGQSDTCLNIGTSFVTACSAFTGTLQSDKGLATADDATLKSQTDQETQKNGLPTSACCSAIQKFTNVTTNCVCDPTIVAYAEAQYSLGSTAATEQALITATRVGTYACTSTLKNGKPVEGSGTLPPAKTCGGSPPSTPPPTKTAG